MYFDEIPIKSFMKKTVLKSEPNFQLSHCPAIELIKLVINVQSNLPTLELWALWSGT